MLLTRCPNCRTAFRVTDGALRAAGGRVRCGRCETVFDANVGRDQPRASAAAGPTLAPDDDRSSAQAAQTTQDAAAGPPPAQSLEPTEAAGASGETSAAQTAADDTFGDLSLADVLEHVASGSDDDEEESAEGENGRLVADPPDRPDARRENPDEDATQNARADAYISPEQIEAVLEDDEKAWPPATPAWELEQPVERPPPSRWWRYGAICAALLLTAQVVHHLRADLAVHDIVGPPLQRAYGWFGVSIVPSWDLEQYRIMDWVATAEPGADGRGSLDITARIQNRGPRAQPYPHVHLQLKDRWERPVGSRVFRPDEYANDGARLPRVMAAGDTTRAHLEIVDPGSEAYGFELDVCLEVQGGALACANDTLFR